jgi:hypothetical protein
VYNTVVVEALKEVQASNLFFIAKELKKKSKPVKLKKLTSSSFEAEKKMKKTHVNSTKNCISIGETRSV